MRQMKEVDGLEKGDPVLDEAITELLERKAVVEKLQEPVQAGGMVQQ